MTALADKLRVSARFARSANLERDVTNTEPLDGYVVTARAIDIVERLAGTAANGAAGGAWSITGPYGSGKSSLAVLLDGVFGEAGEVRDKALALITDVAPDVAAVVHQAHAAHGTQASGFHRAVVTASREPISYTLVRALHSAILRHYGKIPPNSKFKRPRPSRQRSLTPRTAIHDGPALRQARFLISHAVLPNERLC